MCRTMETARLAFGSASPDIALRGARSPDGQSVDVAPITEVGASLSALRIDPAAGRTL